MNVVDDVNSLRSLASKSRTVRWWIEEKFAQCAKNVPKDVGDVGRSARGDRRASPFCDGFNSYTYDGGRHLDRQRRVDALEKFTIEQMFTGEDSRISAVPRNFSDSYSTAFKTGSLDMEEK